MTKKRTVIIRFRCDAAHGNTGGEPTLAPALMETASEVARATGRCRSIGGQTNGTRLTSDVLDLFRRHAFQVGVSLDGPPSVHEAQRGMAAETLRVSQPAPLQRRRRPDVDMRDAPHIVEPNPGVSHGHGIIYG